MNRAGFVDIAEIGSKFEQAQLAPCYLPSRGHDDHAAR